AMDNEAAPAGDNERIASLTETLRACESRIAFLNKQMLFMEECRQFVQQFVDANGIDAGGPAKAE
ncbi:hypothetical protein AB4144_12035, partial [Rhizobiaceae sp. 2RAB30]